MRRVALLLAVLAGAGCVSESSKQHEAAQTAASWVEACSMALAQWADGHTTSPFTRKTLERADEDLQKTRPDVPSYAAGAVDDARRQLAAAKGDVERNDRNGGKERAGALSEVAAELRHAAGEQP